MYLNAFTQTELDEFDVSITEGAESGMIILWGSMALKLARTTCNRQFHALMEVPAYGYDNGKSATYANDEAASFYNSSECPCFADDTCKTPTVSITSRGWIPGTSLPTAEDAKGTTYSADSSSADSPWFESLVFPENPSGTVKDVQLPDPNRRVCDGVYLYPMYFGPDWEVPDTRPDCSSWAFAITKAYSASVRAGTVMYKQDDATKNAVEDILGEVHNMANGLLSEWTWRGQVQLFDSWMAKPYTDPTSWIGAYTSIVKEKWEYVIEGFADCPVVELMNDYKGGYAWFKKTPDYIGHEDGFVTSLFLETLGVKATTYNWGFRGADPSDFGPEFAGYGVIDFTRMHLYRDISVYKEVGRRAKIMCSGGKVADHLMTYPEWAAAHAPTTKRRNMLSVGPHVDETHEESRRRLSEAVPRLTAAQLDFHVANHQEGLAITKNIEKFCAPKDYTTSCLMKYSGGKHVDTRDKRALL